MSLDPHNRRRRLLLAGGSLLALGVVANLDRIPLLGGDPASGDSPATVASTEPEDDADADEIDGGIHRGEEGKMGKPTAQDKQGLYAMKGPKQEVGGSEEIWGGLKGTEVGQAYGVGGVGLVGTGRGGGGTGEGTIGLGNTGLIGKGGGGGTGSGYGRGSGAGFGGRGKRSARRPMSMRPEPTGGTLARPGASLETGFIHVAKDRLSTFSIDVDTASYSASRRELEWGQLPDAESVRIEEFVNYFDYEYAPPTGDAPFSVTTEVGPCPWNPEHQLVHVGLQGKVIAAENLPPRNLVFLVDVSGSMHSEDKLPLVKQSLAQLTETLRAEDRISLVVYAGAAGVVLPPTSGANKGTILAALDRLEAGGSTAGAEGMALAYAQAREAFLDEGVNRVLMASDGDFNVGVSSHDELVKMIEKERRSGIELSVLGYGMGHRDHTMEQLADKGNGNYAYIDSPREAHKVLVEQAGGTLVTIAKDVKIQVELDPARVLSYRLVGYDNRRLAHADFADDSKDAGEIGAGHNVTALYEVVPRPDADADAPWMALNLRYKAPKGSKSSLLTLPVTGPARAMDQTSDDFRFSAAVASFGQLLRKSEHKGRATWASTQASARAAMGDDPTCRRHELVRLIGLAGRAAGDAEVSVEPMTCVPGGPRPAAEPTVEPSPEPTAEVVTSQPEAPAAEPGATPSTVSAAPPADAQARHWSDWVLEVLRLLPPLLALPLFFMALRRPRRRED